MRGYSENDNARKLAAKVAKDAAIEVFRYIIEMIPVIVERVVKDAWKKLGGDLL